MDTELLIEFMSGEDILWKATGIPSIENPIDIEEVYKWIDEDFKNKFISYFNNTSPEDFWESIKFLKFSYYGITPMAMLLTGMLNKYDWFKQKLDEVT